jgi:pimeloyl-ACP methyl ester carboxylesterase
MPSDRPGARTGATRGASVTDSIMPRFLFNARVIAALALAVLLFSLAAQADVVIFKDGYTVHGVKIVKEKTVIIDDKDGPFVVDDPRGMVAIDDGPRWVVFPHSTIQVADVSENNRFKDFAAYTRERNRGDNKLPSTARDAVVTKSWDVKEWTREVKFNDEDPRLKHTVKQQITVITPHYLRIGSSTHTLARYFLTREFKPDFIRSLLVNHPELVEKPDAPDPVRRERLIHFWIQADWLDEAEKDLAQLLKDLPAEKERYARLKSEVNALRAEKAMAEIERARNAGRHQWAIKALESFPKDDVPGTVSRTVINLRAQYDTQTTKFNSAKRLLDALAKKVPADNQFLVEAATAVRDEVHLDTMSRLDMFLTLAERAEKDAKEGRRPAQSPEELLASAISGWHLGKVAADTKVGFAYKVWMTRLMALDYLRNPQKGAREAQLQQYLRGPYALPYDELEKLVSLMPPPDAPSTLSKETTSITLGPTVQYPNGCRFLLRLPEEYQPGRSYPVLILLADPNMDRTPDALLAEFGDLPSRLGYIVAAPEWWDPKKNVYTYTREEQGKVMQLLRHLRRAYQVDCDRVFLWGNGEGASLAMDLGGGHPDLFAGIVPVNPSIFAKLYIRCEYWINFEKLPVYMIMGDKFGPAVNAIRMLSERWMHPNRGFPTLIVSYKGRGLEWFSAELPYAFDWMSRKRRADATKVVGPPRYDGKTNVPGFSSVRRTDNRFHWLSSDDIRPEQTMEPITAEAPRYPAKFSGKIEGNTVDVRVSGMRQLTVWFGRGMVDYSKPVAVRLDTQRKPVTQKITPKIEVLMEDLYERGDRQRPYFEKIELKP